jgi:ricin-type beta-trefoil lectin protein
MHTFLKSKAGFLALLAPWFVASCAPGSSEDFGAANEDLESTNGWAMNGWAMNGLSMNGLSQNGWAMNGWAMNGLSLPNSLSSTTGLMTTSGGRMIMQYMVKCAYAAGTSVTKQDQYGTSYTFQGSIGIAPELATGCDLDCQEKISACMLAHVNNSGQHISIWMVGPDTGIGWDTSALYPYQEGAFFGNIFAAPWQGYYCAGNDMASGEVPGRLGSPLASNVYVDKYGAGGLCKQPAACTVTNSGYTNCNDPAPQAPYAAGHQWKHVITVWRNFESTQMYKICNVYSGKCLGVVGGSTADGASVEQRSYSGALSQDWQILYVSSGNYKVINVASGKALDVSGSQVVQSTYTGASSQLLPIRYIKDRAGYANLVLVNNNKSGYCVSSNSDGGLVQLGTNLGTDYGRWTFTAVGPLSAAASLAASSSVDAGATSGGTSGGTNPCASFCANPTVFTSTNYQAGALGTGAACRETTATLSGLNLSNIAGRTFKVNGTAYVADGNISALPAKVNGGYCFQATAGGMDYASFATW